jgi:hypothetical protein
MAEYFFNFYAIPYFLASVVSISVAVFLLYKKWKDPRVQLFIITQMLIGIFTFAAGMATCSLEPNTWYFWYSIIPASSTMGVSVYFHFSYVSRANKRVFENLMVSMAYIIPFFFMVLFFINPEHRIVESNDSDLGKYGEEFTGIFSFFKPLFYLYLGLMLFLINSNFILMFRRSTGRSRRIKALYFIFSAFIPLIGFTISVLLVEIFNIIPHIQFGLVFLSISGIIIAFGILKHRLFDIELVVKETFTYLVITIILIGIFRLIELVLSYFISSTFFGGDITSRLIAAAIVAALFFPLRGQAAKIGDKLFPKLTKSVKSDHKKNLAIYRKQLELALEDGKISKKELGMLKGLRSDLGITFKDHKLLRQKIRSKMMKK